MTTKTLLILRHSVLDGPGSLEGYFRDAGWHIDFVEAPHDDLSRIDPLAADLVLPLGSGLSVYDEALFPFITAERTLLQRRLAAERPTLGICFGAQLIASALGERVYAAPQKEVGWYPIELLPGAEASPVRHLAPDTTPAVMHWHGDTFDLPAGTTRLARSALCATQAYARGDHLLAFQFHPEVTAANVEGWLVESSFAGEDRAERIGTLRRDTARFQPAMQAGVARCLDEWLAKLP
ncbi:glutamine amidotransferase [uncultured Xylophilus sp.]|uniref:glutamine amidotransferase-related protein n=1 Tax=uncultured Xylophilus sp. TaxID=296832 RepID=UPI0025E0D4EF|nr:glutamine amidotransferase [uncultured Xylophilus sp.]